MRGNTADLTFKQGERISTRERERGTEGEGEGERRICCETSLVGYAFSCMRISVRKKTWSLWMLTRYMRFAPSMLHRPQIYFEHHGCIYGDTSLDVDDLLNSMNIDVTFPDKDKYRTDVRVKRRWKRSHLSRYDCSKRSSKTDDPLRSTNEAIEHRASRVRGRESWGTGDTNVFREHDPKQLELRFYRISYGSRSTNKGGATSNPRSDAYFRRSTSRRSRPVSPLSGNGGISDIARTRTITGIYLSNVEEGRKGTGKCRTRR